MIHIYLLCTQSIGAAYGVGTYIQELKEILLNKKEIFLNIIILRSDEPEFIIKEAEGCRTFYLPEVPLVDDSSTIAKYNKNSWFLLQPHINASPSDKILFHLNFYGESNFISYIKKNYPNCIVIFTIHYQNWCLLINGNTSYFRKLLHKAKNELSDIEKTIIQSYETEKEILHSVDKIICLSKFTKHILIKDYNITSDKIELIYNGIKDEGITLTKEQKEKERIDLSFKDNELIILFVGRLTQIKGVNILIQAFKILLKDYPQAHLVIVGDGNYNSHLEECEGLWKKITFTGRLSKDHLYQFYQIADVGVIPSFHEQCSYVAIEMMMFGIPLVISTSTGLSEMIDNEFNPIKTEVLENGRDATISPEKLASKIINAINYKGYGNSLRTNYLNKFTRTNMGHKYLNMINELKEE